MRAIWKISGVGFLATVLMGCGGPQARYEAGYQDGYAAGYATECGPRAVLIDGGFKTEPYRQGLRAGYGDGARMCRSEAAIARDQTR